MSEHLYAVLMIARAADGNVHVVVTHQVALSADEAMWIVYGVARRRFPAIDGWRDVQATMAAIPDANVLRVAGQLGATVPAASPEPAAAPGGEASR